jgi:hypothetical protein
MNLRRSKATERNQQSSRSHAVCELRLFASGGIVRVVDLAGSERNHDTLKMSAREHRESADINKALCALKDCFAAAHNHQRVPTRAHLLTRVLSDCFVNSRATRHRTTLIATLSPSPTDLAHTINTLDHAIMLRPELEQRFCSVTVELPLHSGGCLSHIPVESWTAAHLAQWLATADGGRFSNLALPTGLTGKELVRLNQTSLTALFAGQLRAARVGEEGAAWVVETGDATQDAAHSRTSVIGRALWRALRREQTFSKNAASKLLFV